MDTDTLISQESDSNSWIPPGATELLEGWPPMLLEPTHDMSITPSYSTFNSIPPMYSCPDLFNIQPSYQEISLSPAAPLLVSIRPFHITPATSAATPRRKLTDEDRRQICLYHEENKLAIQADIGAVFGVNRSTVSKILRQKEKYLSMNRENRSPIKRREKKVPDIAKALDNWARKHEAQGFVVSPDLSEKKKRLFAMACADPDGKQNPATTNWLKKSKQQTDSIDLNAGKKSPHTIASDGETMPHVPSTVDESLISPNELVSAQHGSSQSTLVTTPSTDIDSQTSPPSSEGICASALHSRPPSISSIEYGSRSQAFSPAMSIEISNGNGEHRSSMTSNHSKYESFSDMMVGSHSDGNLQQSSQVDIYDDSSHNSTKHHGCKLSLKSVGNPMH